jgi:methylenetetrahydrofolate dehydrogenase (NAD+)
VFWVLTICLQIVSPLKDVEGLHSKFHYNLYHKYEHHNHPLAPCGSKVDVASVSIRFIQPQSLLSSVFPSASAIPNVENEEPPPGTFKSILPCTPLAIVKCLEYVGVYNKLLKYGDRAYGRIITVINR